MMAALNPCQHLHLWRFSSKHCSAPMAASHDIQTGLLPIARGHVGTAPAAGRCLAARVAAVSDPCQCCCCSLCWLSADPARSLVWPACSPYSWLSPSACALHGSARSAGCPSQSPAHLKLTPHCLPATQDNGTQQSRDPSNLFGAAPSKWQ